MFASSIVDPGNGTRRIRLIDRYRSLQCTIAPETPMVNPKPPRVRRHYLSLVPIALKLD